MNSQMRLLAVACGLILFAGIVATFVVDGDEADLASAEGTTSTSPTTSADKGGGEAPDADGSTTSTVPGETTTSVDGDTTATAPATTAPPTTPAPTAPPTTQPARTGGPTAPGTYTYDTAGTAAGQPVDGTSTLTVSQPDGEGRQTHTNRAPDGESTTVYRHAAEGTYLESMTMSAQGQNFTLRATAPFLLIPANARTGTVTSGRLQGDGLTAVVTFTVVEAAADTSRARIDADITGRVLNTCDVTGTMVQNILARADQLPLETHATSDLNATGGVFCPGRITSDTTSVLRR